jgi:hypothetical protein
MCVFCSILQNFLTSIIQISKLDQLLQIVRIDLENILTARQKESCMFVLRVKKRPVTMRV